MHRLYPILFFALFMLTVPKESAVSGVLTKFSGVRIKVDAHPGLKALGFDKDSIENHVLAFVRKRLPLLVVNESAAPSIRVRVLLQERDRLSYGYVSIQINRQVTIDKTGVSISGVVWQTGGIAAAQSQQARVFILGSLDQLLNKFAAEWNRQNP